MVKDLKFPLSLVEQLVQWSDLQSLASRSTDMEIILKPFLASSYMNVAVDFFRYQF